MMCFILFLLMVFILQWNAQSLIAHGNEFKHALNVWEIKPDIICVQETWLKEGKTFNLIGYDMYRNDRKVSSNKTLGGGCVIFAKKGIPIKYVKEKDTDIQYQVVEVFCKDQNKLNIINVYNPCLNIDESFLAEIESYVNDRTVICGDFNGHNTLWGSKNTDTNGRNIENFIHKHNLICLNNGEGTRINVSHGTMSCIDISLTSCSLGAKCNWSVIQDTWGSDHYPILTEFNEKCYYTPFKSSAKWSIKKGNWENFQIACEEYIDEPDLTNDIEVMYNTYVDQLTKAIDSSFPKTTGHKPTKIPTSWWNEDCKQAILDRKNALKVLKKSYLPNDLIEYKRACANARKIIKKAKKEDWRNFCSTINSQTSSKQIWEKVKGP